MRRSSILLLAAIVTVTPMAFAQYPTPAAGQEAAAQQDIKSFARLDKNQDGQLTKAELPASTMHNQHFANIDTDRNGSLSKMEVDRHLIEDMGMTPGDIEMMDHDMQCMEGMECMEHMEGMEHGGKDTGDDEN